MPCAVTPMGRSWNSYDLFLFCLLFVFVLVGGGGIVSTNHHVTGYGFPVCVQDGAWMLWANCIVAVATEVRVRFVNCKTKTVYFYSGK